MKANELMIWDLVRCTDPKPFIITDIETEWGTPYFCVTGTDCLAVDGGDLQPIPLTAEILEKNGFEQLKYSDRPQSANIWMYCFGRFDSVIYNISNYFLCIKFMEAHRTDLSNIRFVHELQHALRLCGIEKEIVM